jgi:hypothetical protein
MHLNDLVCSCLCIYYMTFISRVINVCIFIKFVMQYDVFSYGFKMYCVSIFACHKGHAYMPNTFVRVSFGFCFFNLN